MVKRDVALLYSGELAKAVGVSADTIRHYEKIGVLPKAARSPSGYRIYSKSAIGRVTVVQRALRIGFTLTELSEVLKARGAPCQRVYELAQSKLKGIAAEIVGLRRTERYLKKVLADWEQRIKRAGKGRKTLLLHTLMEEDWEFTRKGEQVSEDTNMKTIWFCWCLVGYRLLEKT